MVWLGCVCGDKRAEERRFVVAGIGIGQQIPVEYFVRIPCSGCYSLFISIDWLNTFDCWVKNDSIEGIYFW